MDNKRLLKNIALYGGIIIVVVFFFSSVFRSLSTPATLYKYSDVVCLFQDQKVASFSFDYGSC